MGKTAKDRGSTLLESIVALALLCILATSFLGIQTSFAKLNQVSSRNLKTGIYAGNLYEKAKGMSFSELSALTAIGVIWDNNIKYVFEAERYPTDNQNVIDLVIQSESMNSYTIHAYGDSIQNYLSVAGQGILNIALCPDEHHTSIHFMDASGKISEFQFKTNKETLVINIHAYSIKNTQQEILIELNELPSANCLIYIYEHPFQGGQVSIQHNGRVINTKEILKPLREDNISIYSRKTESNIKIPISLQVMAFQQGGQEQPICRKQGIIWIQPY